MNKELKDQTKTTLMLAQSVISHLHAKFTIGGTMTGMVALKEIEETLKAIDAQPVQQSDRAFKNRVIAALGLNPSGLREGKRVTFGDDYLIALITEATKYDDAQQAQPVQPDDQEFDRQAEAATRAAGLGGSDLNPNATSMLDVFMSDVVDAQPVQQEQS